MNKLYLFVFLLVVGGTNAIQCKNEQNEDVDWFMIYKLPKTNHVDQNIQNGVGYIYLTSNNYTNWILSTKSINDSYSIVGITLKKFYTDKNNLAYILYNDQPPNGPSKDSKGHTKGVVLADLQGALWLIHSVPHFINLETYSYPETGIKNGQSFLCISLSLLNLNEVGVQLQYNEPQIYSYNIPDSLKTNLVEIANAAIGVTVSHPPWYRKTTIFAKNTNFTSFAKSKKFGQDLYMDFVAPELSSSLLVETWLDGRGKMVSNCSDNFKVFNVEEIKIGFLNVSFKSTRDHSKWAIGENNSWICIGDINRMEHQESRGGGTVCLTNENLSSHYRKTIQKIEECNNVS